MEFFDSVGKLIADIALFPFVFYLVFLLFSNKRIKRSFGTLACAFYGILVLLHSIRYIYLYATVGFVKFPFPLVVYPCLIGALILLMRRDGLLFVKQFSITKGQLLVYSTDGVQHTLLLVMDPLTREVVSVALHLDDELIGPSSFRIRWSIGFTTQEHEYPNGTLVRLDPLTKEVALDLYSQWEDKASFINWIAALAHLGTRKEDLALLDECIGM